jgi:hypothetical protein
MKKINKIFTLLLAVLFLTACSTEPVEFEESFEEINSLDSRTDKNNNLRAKIPSSNISLSSRYNGGQSVSLNTRPSTSVYNVLSNSSDRIYTENSGRTAHTFYINKDKGHPRTGPTSGTQYRTEAAVTSMSPSLNNFRVFQAKMKVNIADDTDGGQLTVFQLFSILDVNPHLALRVNDSGDVKLNGVTVLTGNYNKGNQFFFRIETDGYTFRFKIAATGSPSTLSNTSWLYFNTSLNGGITNSSTSAGAGRNFSFRWGSYNTDVNPKGAISNLVSNIYVRR